MMLVDVPTYEYRCDNGHTFEMTQSMSEDALDTCTVCGASARRILFAPAVHFKGSGFYTTDYAGKGSAAKGANGSDGSDGSDGSKSDSKDSKKSEGKSDSGSADSSSGSSNSGGDSGDSGSSGGSSDSGGKAKSSKD
jgi:putative FmdB family regulatory protein